MKMHKDLVEALERRYEELPKWIRTRTRLVVIDGEPKENTTVRTCKNWDEDGCVVTYNRVIKVKGRMRCVERVSEFKWAPLLRDNPWWADRGVHEEQERIDSDLLDELDDETRIALHRKSKAWGSTYEPMLDGMAMQYEEPRPCIHKLGKIWVACPHHTGYAKARRVLGSDLTLDEKAELLLPFFLRPDRRVKKPPVDEPWTWEDWFNHKAWLTDIIIRLTTRDKNPVPLEKARKWAWKKLIYQQYPDYKRHEAWMPIGPKASRKPSTVHTLGARIDAYLHLRDVNVTADFRELIRVYRHLLKYDQDLGLVPNFPQSMCPIVREVPSKDHIAPKIIRGTACLFNLEKVTDETKTPKWIPWVRCGDVDEDAKTFNKRPLEERLSLLGCTCKDCPQNSIFIDEGDRFRIAGEVLLDEEKFEHYVLPQLVEQYELGHDGITGEEEEFMFQTLYDMSVDTTELPSYQEGYDLMDPNEMEETDNPWGNLNQLEMMDKIEKRIDDYYMNGPVQYLKGKKHLDANDRAWNKKIREAVKESKAADKRHKAWMKEYRSHPAPEPVKRPKLKPAALRAKAVRALDRRLEAMDQQQFGELNARIKAYKSVKAWEEQIGIEARESWWQKYVANHGLPERGENSVHKPNAPRIRRESGMRCLYPPFYFSALFPMSIDEPTNTEEEVLEIIASAP